MPGNRRGSLEDISKVMTDTAKLCQNEGIADEVTVAIIVAMGSIVETAIKDAEYELTAPYAH